MYEITGAEREQTSPSRGAGLRANAHRRTFDATDAEGRSVIVEVRADLPPLLDEARALVGLAHPALAPVLDAGEEDGGWFVVRERWSGPRFDALLSRKPLAPERVVALLHPVAAALDRLHEVGVTHCAFCPENLVVSCEEAPRLWVVGVPSGPAFATSSADTDDTQTLTIKALEGLDYVPPDLLESPARPDVYALAVLTFRLLAGELPFRSYPTLTQTLVGRQERAPAGLAELARRPMLPALERWMRAALSREAHLRPPTAAALMSGLARVTGSVIGDHEAALREMKQRAFAPETPPVSAAERRTAPELTSVAIELDGMLGDLDAREASIPPPSDPALEDTAPTPVVQRSKADGAAQRWTGMAGWFALGVLILVVAAIAVARMIAL